MLSFLTKESWVDCDLNHTHDCFVMQFQVLDKKNHEHEMHHGRHSFHDTAYAKNLVYDPASLSDDTMPVTYAKHLYSFSLPPSFDTHHGSKYLSSTQNLLL